MGRYQEAVQASEQEITALEALAETSPFVDERISSARISMAFFLVKAGHTEEAIRAARANVEEELRTSPET
jgi:hypothetical protein